MTSDFWNGKRVLVTGAAGFIGSHVVDLLAARGARVTAVVSPDREPQPPNLRAAMDKIRVLRARLDDAAECRRVCRGQEIVFSLAHLDGSAAFKRDRPALVFRQNMLVTLNLLEAAQVSGVARVLVMSSAEVYAPEVPLPMQEADGFRGLPPRLADGYCWSKRMSEFAAELYSREHGLQVAIARPSNVYGPRDGFQPQRGRVIPRFIHEIHQGTGPLVIWGTGKQMRSFLYVGDLARGLLDLVERYPVCDPVNFSSEREISIADLARLIVRLSGRPTEVVYALDKPEGPPIRRLSIDKAREKLGFSETVSLEEGLRLTIQSYRADGLRPEGGPAAPITNGRVQEMA